MSKELDTIRHSILPGAERERAGQPVPIHRSDAFVTLRYSYTEISARGGEVHVKRTETRFEDGKITSEECEGRLDRAAYDDMVWEAQGRLLNQVAGLMKLFFLPFSGR